jgi:hypothetical protein
MRDNTEIGSGSEFSTVWDTLKMFWKPEEIKSWYDAIFDTPARTEVCQNLLCLSKNLYNHWTRAQFALKPVSLSLDKTVLEMQFFWMKSEQRVMAKTPIAEIPLLDLTESEHAGLSGEVMTSWTGAVKNGRIIRMTTDDPIVRPLPDIRLLDMQFLLQRLRAMRGAAEPNLGDLDDSDGSDDSDDDDDTSAALWEEAEEATAGRQAPQDTLQG